MSKAKTKANKTNKNKSCVCHGQQAGMGQTCKISAGAPEIDRKSNDTYDLMCQQNTI